MRYRRLGRSDLEVSLLCLGTMTWGEQNSEAEAFAQMDFAVAQGVNFFDTAEMYPVAPRPETYGRTEEIIGAWLARRGRPDGLVLATKAVGPGERFRHVRDGFPRFSARHLTAAVEASLKRLRSETIDLYQLHWPERNANTFGMLGYKHLPEEEAEATPLTEVLAALDGLVRSGKVRTVGVSNETPWGLMTFLKLSEAGLGPRMVSIQNPYSILNRSFEHALAEVALREEVALMAYAPLAAGTLSGKYLGGARPPGARMTLWPQNRRYLTPRGEEATAAYVALAREAGLDPSLMAHAFVFSREFVTASIVGATRLEHLKTALAALEFRLPSDLLKEIEAIGERYTYPCP